MENKFKIFCDFDGTIMKKDIGDEIFKVFGDFELYHTLLIEKNIDIKSYWSGICKTLDSNLTKEKIEEFANGFEVDAYFVPFIKFCEANNIPITIVSDGFDLYILPILKKLGLSHLDVFCNELRHDGERFYPYFTRASESCNCLSASCKRNVVINLSSESDIIVYIGDGYSDFCGAEHSDIIFAKKHLANYCNNNKLPHYPFSTFFDIKKIFADVILNKKKFKKRNQAKVNILKALETE